MSKPSLDELREQAAKLYFPSGGLSYKVALGDKDHLDRIVLALQDAYTAGHNDGQQQRIATPGIARAVAAEPEKPEKNCSNETHWHKGHTIPSEVCVRGLINGLQQYSAGVNWALTEIEKERP